ncbi:uncharacterized protein ColSpa_05900 [Colletotrichum spaethianum]|uniref:Uncharacterized protein n=1 Tax=Colletotrichum spaethianum TaxID=700344 RepID=A0AA37LG10_9PEZI|nr:uncharacterized protein ColSpa_05900 [Colletotrichum spaethianum]GKT45719.1 hypothetical protein ColSpa_05900 [Colletotrichum spaethianum]
MEAQPTESGVACTSAAREYVVEPCSAASEFAEVADETRLSRSVARVSRYHTGTRCAVTAAVQTYPSTFLLTYGCSGWQEA